MTRYAWGPLEQVVDARLGEAVRENRQIQGPNDVRRAELLGVHYRQISRWRKLGLDQFIADRCAIRVGCLPYEIWPAWLDDAVMEFAKTCAAPNCEATFFPYRRQNIYCSATCKKKVENLRAAQEDTARERRAAAQRRYYAQNRERLRVEQNAYARRRYQAERSHPSRTMEPREEVA